MFAHDYEAVAYVLFRSSISSTWHSAVCFEVGLLQVVLQVCHSDLHNLHKGTEGSCSSTVFQALYMPAAACPITASSGELLAGLCD